MRDRCRRVGRADAHCYAMKEVAIDPRWDDFVTFCGWAMTNGYHDGLTIDRIDSNGDYVPENCRWVDRKVQARNISRNRLIEFRNEVRCLSEWSEITGISGPLISARIGRLGWTLDDALTVPIGERKRGPKKHDHI